MKTLEKIFKSNIFIIGATFALPGIIAFLVKDAFSSYNALILPKFAPKPIAFPIAWGILYLLMSIACIKCKNNNKCLIVYYIQLVLNAIWTPIFFKYHNYLLALIDLAVLLLVVIYMAYIFYKEDKDTLFMILPYVIWLIFAYYLNYNVYLLN